MTEGFDFENIGKQFDANAIMFEELAKIAVPQFMAFRQEGLGIREAAALVVAMINYHTPDPPDPNPKED